MIFRRHNHVRAAKTEQSSLVRPSKRSPVLARSAGQAVQGSQGVGAIPRRQRRRSRAVVGLCRWASAQGGPSHELILPGAALSAPPTTSHTAKRGRIFPRRHHLPARVAAAVLSAAAIVVAGAVWLPAAAQASEAVTSFKTTLVEPVPPLENDAATGTVEAAPTSESFTLKEPSGSKLTVKVSPSTIYREFGAPNPTLGNVGAGDFVEVVGPGEGIELTATKVQIADPTAGIVQAAPSGESFTIETLTGSTDTVEVSPSTTYVKAKPEPGETSPTLADVGVGDYVGIVGPLSGHTVTATGVGISVPQAGGHPDLTTSFALAEPGQPEAAQNVIFNAPTGVFGNPRAITQCPTSEFALDAVPPRLPGRPDHPPRQLRRQPRLPPRHRPDLLDRPLRRGNRPLRLRRPRPRHPDRDPRSGPHHRRLRPPLHRQRHHPAHPPRLRQDDLLGLPRRIEPTRFERFPKGTPGNPTGCPGEEGTACLAKAHRCQHLPPAAHRQPHHLHRAPAYRHPRSRNLRRPHPSPGDRSHLPHDRRLRKRGLQPRPPGLPDHQPDRLRLGLERRPQIPPVPHLRLRALRDPLRHRHPARRLHHQPRRRRRPDRMHRIAGKLQLTKAPPNAPTPPRSAPSRSAPPPSPNASKAPSIIGEPKPGDQYRLFMTASGFGMNIKLVGSVIPNPKTGQLIAEFPNLPQAPFEDFQLHLFSGERALMATPTACTIYPVERRVLPLERHPRRTDLQPDLQPRIGSPRLPVPGPGPPLHPNPRSRHLQRHRRRLLQLRPQAEPRRRRPGPRPYQLHHAPGPHRQPARRHLLLRRGDRPAAANTPGRTEQADPSCPASSEIGTSNVAAGPGTHPFHATGKIYLAGPFQGAPLSLVVVTPALAGPYDYGTVVVRVALHIDPLDAHVIADSQAVPEIIGGIPLRIRSIQVNINKPNFMINPTNCSEFHTTSEGVGDQGTAVSFTSPFIAVNCDTLPFAPKMSITQLGGHKATARSKDPSLAIELNTTSGRCQHQIAHRHPAQSLRDRPAPPRQHLRPGRTRLGPVRRPPADRRSDHQHAAARSPPQGPCLCGLGLRRLLPHLAFILAGQVTLMPEAESSSVQHGRLKTVVPVIPDAPIGHFRFTLFGGSQGYLSNTQSLCSAPTALHDRIQRPKRQEADPTGKDQDRV